MSNYEKKGVMKAEIQDAQARAFEDVENEVSRQIAKWGVQSHPDGTGPEVALYYYFEGNETMQWLADFYTEVTDDAFALGIGTWKDILTEEVYEAYAEEDARTLYAELTQVAAVAISWMRDIITKESA